MILLIAALSCDGAQNGMTNPPPDWVVRTAEPREPEVGRQPPLLVMLHGIGADENDLFPIAPLLDGRLKVASLRAPRSYAIGYSWFDIAFHADGTLTPDVEQARDALDGLVRWLDAAPGAYGTDPRRTFLLGFSQGAMMSLGVLRTAPDLVAGVVALSGRSPAGLFEERADPDDVARVPLLVAHGTHDEVLPVAHGRGVRDAFESLSVDFQYREYPVGHGINEEEIRFVSAWLTKRIDGAVAE